MKTKSNSLITKKLQMKIKHHLSHIQQSTSAIIDVYTARESQFDNIYSRNIREGMLHSPANLLLRIYLNKISRQVVKS